jgi:hypothetical protein
MALGLTVSAPCVWALQIEKRIDQNMVVARELIAQHRNDRALLALKKKKLKEAQLRSINAWLLNLEDVVRFARAATS